MLTKIYGFMQQEEMLGWKRKLMLKQMSIIIIRKQNWKKSSKRIVSSINIFINICYGLKILKAIVYAFLEFRYVVRLYVPGGSWKGIFFLSFSLFLVCVCVCVCFVEPEHTAIEYAMNRKFMEGRIMSIWGKFNYFYNLDKLHNLL